MVVRVQVRTNKGIVTINQFMTEEMTEQELNDLIDHSRCSKDDLIDHFEQQIELAYDYIELEQIFKDIDLLEFICVNKKVIEKLKS